MLVLSQRHIYSINQYDQVTEKNYKPTITKSLQIVENVNGEIVLNIEHPIAQ